MGKAATYSVADLERMLGARRSQLEQLTKRRDKLRKELDKVEQQISGLEGSKTSRRGAPPGRRRRGGRRARNEKSLHDYVAEILTRAKKPMKLNDLSDKVLEAGYKTNSKNFKNVLYQCLYNADEIVHDDQAGGYRIK